jgi:hypothetical protein
MATRRRKVSSVGRQELLKTATPAGAQGRRPAEEASCLF